MCLAPFSGSIPVSHVYQYTRVWPSPSCKTVSGRTVYMLALSGTGSLSTPRSFSVRTSGLRKSENIYPPLHLLDSKIGHLLHVTAALPLSPRPAPLRVVYLMLLHQHRPLRTVPRPPLGRSTASDYWSICLVTSPRKRSFLSARSMSGLTMRSCTGADVKRHHPMPSSSGPIVSEITTAN